MANLKKNRSNKKTVNEKYCAYCDHTGIIHTTGFEHLGEAPLIPCPKCVEPKCKCGGEDPYYYLEDGDIKDCFCREIRMKIDRINKIYNQSGIEKKFRWKFFGDYESRDEMATRAKNLAYDIVMKFPDVKKGLYLWGNPGTGKTLLSIIILTELVIRHAIDGKFISISRGFFKKLQATFVDGSDTYGESGKIERQLEEVDILIVDDFGIEKETAWKQETLYNLVDARYEAEKFTIFTSNRNPNVMFKEFSEGRVLSRIKEMCQVIEVSGVDYRESL